MRYLRLLLFPLILSVAATGITVADQKVTIAVLNLKCTSGVTEGEADIISDRLRVEIFKTGNVDVMEREQMQSVLSEQGFQASGACSDEGCMVEMGQLLGVKFLITGSIGRLGSLYLFNARSINVASGKIEKVVSIDIKGNLEDVVDELPRIARQVTSSEKSEPIVIYSSEVASRPEPSSSPSTDAETPGNCKNTVFLQSIDFGKVLSFIPETETRDEIDKDLRESLEGAVQDKIDDDLRVIVIYPEQIPQLPEGCTSGLVKVVLDSYSTKTDDDELIGTATASFYLFDTPKSSQPVFKLTITKSGSGDSGDQKALMDAFEELEDVLEEQITRTKQIRCLNPNKKR